MLNLRQMEGAVGYFCKALLLACRLPFILVAFWMSTEGFTRESTCGAELSSPDTQYNHTFLQPREPLL